MTDEPITIGELGGYTNNSPNKEGLKKLVEKVNNGAPTYTAGDNIEISAENVISATDTTYTAGDNVQISEQNVISATDTKYTAGTGISISAENVISASGGSNEWTLRTGTYDWSDLFENDNGILKTKKDILFIYGDRDNSGFSNLYPKGFNYGGTSFYIGTQIALRNDGNSLISRYSMTLKSNQITTDKIEYASISATPVINNGVLDYGKVQSINDISNIKGFFKIYVKE